MAIELVPHGLTKFRDISPLLTLTTHAYAPPLTPPAHIKYDLRTVPNPPKSIRDAYTGVSKRLRDHMLEHEVFVQMLDRAEGEITAEMNLVLEEWKVENGEANLGEVDGWESELAEVERDQDARPILAVSVFCARGKHRSVAFVEELARRAWPREWEVQVNHRDLEKARGDVKGKRGRGGKAREIDSLRDSADGIEDW
jgi:RNase adaptor protein for sRNA GlmZ degradation